MANPTISDAHDFGAQRADMGFANFDWSHFHAEGAADAAWSVREAFFAILFSAAAGDAQINALERDALTALVHRSKTLRALDREELLLLHRTVLRKLEMQGPQALEHACHALPLELRLPSFANALDIILSDGELGPAEAAALNALVSYLEISEADVLRVADILLMKSRV